MPKYHGIKGMAYLAASGAGAATNVANLSAWTINLERDKAEVTALGDTWKTFVRGAKGGSVTMAGFWANDADVPFDAFDDDTTTINVYLYPTRDVTTQYWYGEVWPDSVNLDSPNSGPVGFNFAGTFDGTVTRQG